MLVLPPRQPRRSQLSFLHPRVFRKACKWCETSSDTGGIFLAKRFMDVTFGVLTDYTGETVGSKQRGYG